MTTTQHLMFSVSGHHWLSWLTDGFGRRKKAHLDVRELSPHLRRDLGLLDGNDPCGRWQS
ncbi:MAG: hypothetical protein IKE42_22180 [Aquamicrobium sp.]|jgi:hypothetical protein|uniref:hypothetical protein n=1 Tax=Mesorhizobium TaxID=68287 RepID=UPI001010AB90|nr:MULTISPECIES: hypothetical protein [Mesorhizobium]MBR2690569.1 hypothetical protein [Aquamicrobium sp.]QAZ43189.1 hypothetical protein C1M53_09625 [Mesorhizobium sp. Pch-S]